MACRLPFIHIQIPLGATRRYVADLLIALLQNYAAATALFPVSLADREEAAQGLPEPMLPGNWDSATGVCLHDESLKSAMVLVRLCSRHLLACRAPACDCLHQLYHRHCPSRGACTPVQPLELVRRFSTAALPHTLHVIILAWGPRPGAAHSMEICLHPARTPAQRACALDVSLSLAQCTRLFDADAHVPGLCEHVCQHMHMLLWLPGGRQRALTGWTTPRPMARTDGAGLLSI